MNPNGVQFSINCLFNDNAVGYPGFTLPRSFTLIGHKKRAYDVPFDFSINHSRGPILDHFSLASIWGNSRALFLSIIRRNQTRILFVLDLAQRLFWGLVAAHQSRLELNVPYTVITGT